MAAIYHEDELPEGCEIDYARTVVNERGWYEAPVRQADDE